MSKRILNIVICLIYFQANVVMPGLVFSQQRSHEQIVRTYQERKMQREKTSKLADLGRQEEKQEMDQDEREKLMKEVFHKEVELYSSMTTSQFSEDVNSIILNYIYENGDSNGKRKGLENLEEDLKLLKEEIGSISKNILEGLSEDTLLELVFEGMGGAGITVDSTEAEEVSNWVSETFTVFYENIESLFSNRVNYQVSLVEKARKSDWESLLAKTENDEGREALEKTSQVAQSKAESEYLKAQAKIDDLLEQLANIPQANSETISQDMVNENYAAIKSQLLEAMNYLKETETNFLSELEDNRKSGEADLVSYREQWHRHKQDVYNENDERIKGELQEMETGYRQLVNSNQDIQNSAKKLLQTQMDSITNSLSKHSVSIGQLEDLLMSYERMNEQYKEYGTLMEETDVISDEMVNGIKNSLEEARELEQSLLEELVRVRKNYDLLGTKTKLDNNIYFYQKYKQFLASAKDSWQVIKEYSEELTSKRDTAEKTEDEFNLAKEEYDNEVLNLQKLRDEYSDIYSELESIQIQYDSTTEYIDVLSKRLTENGKELSRILIEISSNDAFTQKAELEYLRNQQQANFKAFENTMQDYFYIEYLEQKKELSEKTDEEILDQENKLLDNYVELIGMLDVKTLVEKIENGDHIINLQKGLEALQSYSGRYSSSLSMFSKLAEVIYRQYREHQGNQEGEFSSEHENLYNYYRYQIYNDLLYNKKLKSEEINYNSKDYTSLNDYIALRDSAKDTQQEAINDYVTQRLTILQTALESIKDGGDALLEESVEYSIAKIYKGYLTVEGGEENSQKYTELLNSRILEIKQTIVEYQKNGFTSDKSGFDLYQYIVNFIPGESVGNQFKQKIVSVLLEDSISKDVSLEDALATNFAQLDIFSNEDIMTGFLGKGKYDMTVERIKEVVGYDRENLNNLEKIENKDDIEKIILELVKLGEDDLSSGLIRSLIPKIYQISLDKNIDFSNQKKLVDLRDEKNELLDKLNESSSIRKKLFSYKKNIAAIFESYKDDDGYDFLYRSLSLSLLTDGKLDSNISEEELSNFLSGLFNDETDYPSIDIKQLQSYMRDGKQANLLSIESFVEEKLLLLEQIDFAINEELDTVKAEMILHQDGVLSNYKYFNKDSNILQQIIDSSTNTKEWFEIRDGIITVDSDASLTDSYYQRLISLGTLEEEISARGQALELVSDQQDNLDKLEARVSELRTAIDADQADKTSNFNVLQQLSEQKNEFTYNLNNKLNSITEAGDKVFVAMNNLYAKKVVYEYAQRPFEFGEGTPNTMLAKYQNIYDTVDDRLQILEEVRDAVNRKRTVSNEYEQLQEKKVLLVNLHDKLLQFNNEKDFKAKAMENNIIKNRFLSESAFYDLHDQRIELDDETIITEDFVNEYLERGVDAIKDFHDGYESASEEKQIALELMYFDLALTKEAKKLLVSEGKELSNKNIKARIGKIIFEFSMIRYQSVYNEDDNYPLIYNDATMQEAYAMTTKISTDEDKTKKYIEGFLRDYFNSNDYRVNIRDKNMKDSERKKLYENFEKLTGKNQVLADTFMDLGKSHIQDFVKNKVYQDMSAAWEEAVGWGWGFIAKATALTFGLGPFSFIAASGIIALISMAGASFHRADALKDLYKQLEHKVLNTLYGAEKRKNDLVDKQVSFYDYYRLYENSITEYNTYIVKNEEEMINWENTLSSLEAHDVAFSDEEKVLLKDKFDQLSLTKESNIFDVGVQLMKELQQDYDNVAKNMEDYRADEDILITQYSNQFDNDVLDLSLDSDTFRERATALYSKDSAYFYNNKDFLDVEDLNDYMLISNLLEKGADENFDVDTEAYRSDILSMIQNDNGMQIGALAINELKLVMDNSYSSQLSNNLDHNENLLKIQTLIIGDTAYENKELLLGLEAKFEQEYLNQFNQFGDSISRIEIEWKKLISDSQEKLAFMFNKADSDHQKILLDFGELESDDFVGRQDIANRFNSQMEGLVKDLEAAGVILSDTFDNFKEQVTEKDLANDDISSWHTAQVTEQEESINFINKKYSYLKDSLISSKDDIVATNNIQRAQSQNRINFNDLVGIIDQRAFAINNYINTRRAMLAKENIAKAYYSLRESIESMNKTNAYRFDSLLTAYGYKEVNNVYKRTVMVDSTVWGREKEEQTVLAYEDLKFDDDELKTSVDISTENLEKLDTNSIGARIDAALRSVISLYQVIFGTGNENENGEKWYQKDGLNLLLGVSNKLSNRVKEATAQYYSSAQVVRSAFSSQGKDSDKDTKTGLFAFHIGYDPIMKTVTELEDELKEKNKNSDADTAADVGIAIASMNLANARIDNPAVDINPVKTEGYGQQGKIMGDFLNNFRIESTAAKLVSVSPFSQPWTDEDPNNDGLKERVSFNLKTLSNAVFDLAGMVASIFPPAGLIVEIGRAAFMTSLDVFDASFYGLSSKQFGLNLAQTWGTAIVGSALAAVPGGAAKGITNIAKKAALKGVTEGTETAMKSGIKNSLKTVFKKAATKLDTLGNMKIGKYLARPLVDTAFGMTSDAAQKAIHGFRINENGEIEFKTDDFVGNFIPGVVAGLGFGVSGSAGKAVSSKFSRARKIQLAKNPEAPTSRRLSKAAEVATLSVLDTVIHTGAFVGQFMGGYGGSLTMLDLQSTPLIANKFSEKYSKAINKKKGNVGTIRRWFGGRKQSDVDKKKDDGIGRYRKLVGKKASYDLSKPEAKRSRQFYRNSEPTTGWGQFAQEFVDTLSLTAGITVNLGRDLETNEVSGGGGGIQGGGPAALSSAARRIYEHNTFDPTKKSTTTPVRKSDAKPNEGPKLLVVNNPDVFDGASALRRLHESLATTTEQSPLPDVKDSDESSLDVVFDPDGLTLLPDVYDADAQSPLPDVKDSDEQSPLPDVKDSDVSSLEVVFDPDGLTLVPYAFDADAQKFIYAPFASLPDVKDADAQNSLPPDTFDADALKDFHEARGKTIPLKRVDRYDLFFAQSRLPDDNDPVQTQREEPISMEEIDADMDGGVDQAMRDADVGGVDQAMRDADVGDSITTPNGKKKNSFFKKATSYEERLFHHSSVFSDKMPQWLVNLMDGALDRGVPHGILILEVENDIKEELKLLDKKRESYDTIDKNKVVIDYEHLKEYIAN